MTFKKIALGKRIGIGFTLILVVLAAVVILSIKGIGTVIHSAGEVIDGNQLDGILAQREIDHLNCANKVTALLTDDSVTELEVETNDHECAFGKWLYWKECGGPNELDSYLKE